MAVAGKGDSTRPLLTSKEEFYLRDKLWRSKNPHRREEIKRELAQIEQLRRTTSRRLQND